MMPELRGIVRRQCPAAKEPRCVEDLAECMLSAFGSGIGLGIQEFVPKQTKNRTE